MDYECEIQSKTYTHIVATVEHGVPLVLPKWVHSLWAQDEDGQGQEPSQAGGFTLRPRESQARSTPTEGSGPGVLPGPRITPEDTEDPEGPSSRQEAGLPLGCLPAPLRISSPPQARRLGKQGEGGAGRRHSPWWCQPLSTPRRTLPPNPKETLG